MDFKKLEQYLTQKNEAKYRFSQIKQAVLSGFLDFNKIQTIPAILKNDLTNNFRILSFDACKIQTSNDNATIKTLLKTVDSNYIETVLMRNKSGWTVCVSSQIGCSLACVFCATGDGGFKRNLTTEEITDQILFWRNYLKEKASVHITNIVYMGAGEPFLNWENVKLSLTNLTDPNLFNIGARSISISTAGITEGILNLANTFPQINLAISLHSADQAKRQSLMPIAAKYSLQILKQAIQTYLNQTNRKIFIEYILLKDQNDTADDLQKLVTFIKSFTKNNLLHINLIPYNKTGKKLNPSVKKKCLKFHQELLKNRLHATIRHSLGDDIQGACGQLACQQK